MKNASEQGGAMRTRRLTVRGALNTHVSDRYPGNTVGERREEAGLVPKSTGPGNM